MDNQLKEKYGLPTSSIVTVRRRVGGCALLTLGTPTMCALSILTVRWAATLPAVPTVSRPLAPSCNPVICPVRGS